MSVLDMLPDHLKASKKVIEERQQICNSCPFRVNSTGSCGRLIIGTRINYEGKEIRTCGCITNEKTILKTEKCDLGKW